MSNMPREDIAILDAYIRQEMIRKYEIFKTLLLEHPSLDSFIEEYKNKINEDHLNHLTKLVVKMIMIKGQFSDILKLQSSGEITEEILQSRPELAKVLSLAKKTVDTCDQMIQFPYIIEEFYHKIIKKAKELGEEKKIEPTTSMESQGFRDEVFRRVFPNVNDAEKFLEQDAKLTSDFLTLIYNTAEINKFVAPEEPFPAVLLEDVEAVIMASREYSLKELERIYLIY